MPNYDTYGCYIEVNGERLPEYLDPAVAAQNGVSFRDDGVPVITRWIPSNAGQVSQS